MKKQAILFILTLLYSFCACAQEDDWSYSSKWQYRPVVGADFGIGPQTLKTAFKNNLGAYQDRSVYIHLFNLTYFFSKHWGIEANEEICFSDYIKVNGEDFKADLKTAYGDNYYAVLPESATHFKPLIYGGHSLRLNAGLIYRIENRRWYFYPKLSIGSTSFDITPSWVYLKEKNTHKILNVKTNDKFKYSSDVFTMGLSASGGYKLAKQFFLNLDLGVTYCEPHFSYTRKLEDVETGMSLSEQEIDLKGSTFNFKWGAGLILVFCNRKDM
ncbi:MAG: hypothetical protein V4543_12525 [Bacteroidota bacterium]